MNQDDVYLTALNLIQQNSGTSGAIGLAKCILSIYNERHRFSMGEILYSLDSNYSALVIDMITEYSKYGEDEALKFAGRWVYDNYKGLIELSDAMNEAHSEVWRKWATKRNN